MSDTTDFYDMIEWSKKWWVSRFNYFFYDYNNGKIYRTIYKKQRNVLYWPTCFILKKSFLGFLQGDYNSGKITLFRYLPDKIPELIIQFNIADVDLYNLRIIGEDIYITSEDDEFVSYYPESFRFPTTPNESVCMIVDGKVYLSAWVEESWDDDNNCATEEYKYYEKIDCKRF